MSKSPTRTCESRHWLRHTCVRTLAAATVAMGLLSSIGEVQARESLVRYDAVYYSGTGSYFQLVKDTREKRNGVSWQAAANAAQQLTYKGRQGRLAVVDKPSIHALLLEAYPDRANLRYGGRAWIGLRYWCGSRMLTWVTLEEHRSSAFGPWARPWHRSRVTCASNIPYMGVFYENNNQWVAEGPLKRFPFYFVEYPTDTAAGG